jgi:hypothetical protein
VLLDRFEQPPLVDPPEQRRLDAIPHRGHGDPLQRTKTDHFYIEIDRL